MNLYYLVKMFFLRLVKGTEEERSSDLSETTFSLLSCNNTKKIITFLLFFHFLLTEGQKRKVEYQTQGKIVAFIQAKIVYSFRESLVKLKLVISCTSLLGIKIGVIPLPVKMLFSTLTLFIS